MFGKSYEPLKLPRTIVLGNIYDTEVNLLNKINDIQPFTLLNTK